MSAYDDAIARLAQGQHGAFTGRQARHAGMTRAAARHRAASGAWEHVVSDVFRIPGTPRGWRHDLAVAVLAVNTAAAVSERAAAALLNMPGFGPGPVEVTRLRGNNHDAVIGRLHETRTLPKHHLVVVDGLVVTNVVRTVFDLAGRLHPERVERLLDWCLRNDGLQPKFERMLEELGGRGRAGIALMRELLAERGSGYVAPESDLESKAIQLLRLHGLPEPIRQLDAGDDERWLGRVDLAYPDHRALLEIDGRAWHTVKTYAEQDALRRAQLAAAGWRVLPIREELLDESPGTFIDLVRTALHGCPAPFSPEPAVQMVVPATTSTASSVRRPAVLEPAVQMAAPTTAGTASSISEDVSGGSRGGGPHRRARVRGGRGWS